MFAFKSASIAWLERQNFLWNGFALVKNSLSTGVCQGWCYRFSSSLKMYRLTGLEKNQDFTGADLYWAFLFLTIDFGFNNFFYVCS